MNIGRSEHFSDHFANLSFEKRMEPVLRRSIEGLSRVEVASDGGEAIGYSIATIDKEYVAEVDSIFVKEGYRDQDLGGMLLDRALDWIDAFPVRRTFLTVTFGNKEVSRFYMRHGLYPRLTVFERKNESGQTY